MRSHFPCLPPPTYQLALHTLDDLRGDAHANLALHGCIRAALAAAAIHQTVAQVVFMLDLVEHQGKDSRNTRL